MAYELGLDIVANMRLVASGSVDGKSSRGGYKRLTMLGRSELRRRVIVGERMGKVEPSPLDIFRLIHCLCQTMIKPASQMAIAPKRILMFLIDPLTMSPEFVLKLVDCAPGLTDEEPGNAGLVMLNVLLSPEEVAELVEDGSELVPDAEAAAGSYKNE